jgi:uncharacterized protein (TIGR03435 family)
VLWRYSSMKRHVLALLAVLIPLALPNRAAAQSAPAFAAASVKPSAEAAGPAAMFPLILPQPGRLTARNATLRALVRTAYGVEDFQVEGGPSWAASQRFEILATIAPGSSPTDVWPMLRTLLADRFGLKAHIVQREMAAFSLVRARGDGSLGPDLKRSTADCSAPRGCGVTPFGRNGGFAMRATGQSMAVLTRLISQALGQPVLDRTGLDGGYDFELAFDTSDLAARAAQSGLIPPGVAATPSDDPPLVTALQEQLGLKLERQRAPIDVVVIGAATMPVPD